ncbi:putative response regulatory protein [compost metagenome]
MLRLVIVDDEVLIREGLAKMIQKENASFQVVGLFGDGQDVLDALPQLEVDVIITDIRMPLVGGLALIKEVKSSYPHIRTILMSGFVDFSYAQEAIRCSAVDYLLKPINKEHLFELLYRLHQEQQDKYSEQKSHRIALLSAFLLQGRREEQYITSFPWMEVTLPAPYYVVFKIKSTDASNLQRYAHQLQDMEIDILWPQQACQLWIAYFTVSPSHSQLQLLGQQLLNWAQEAGEALHIGCSGAHSEFNKLQDAAEIARYACELGIYEKKDHYFSFQDTLPPIQKLQDIAELQSNLMSDLQILHIEHIHLWMKQCFQHLKEFKGGSGQIYDVCHRIWGDIEREVSEWHTYFEKDALQDLKNQIGIMFNYDEIVNHVVHTFTSKLEIIRSQRLARNTTATLMIKEWINDHYSEHADLGSLASMVFLTPTYLSKLFKQETGYTITDYVTEVRLHHAKQLLSHNQHLKVQEIGRQVGYADPAYFNKLFKRMVGVTPAEFKKIAHSDKQA